MSSDDTVSANHLWLQPPRGRSILRGLRRRCPVCGSRSISRHPAHLEEHCPRCGLHLERQVGSFIGGVGLNTIVGLGALVITIAFGFLVTQGESGALPILIPALVMALLLPIWFYARSRLLWVAIELIWWPLVPGELDSKRSE